ncbi:MAG: DUF84 family protein [bacterium]
MKHLTIAVGTTSAQKISYLKEALDEIGIEASLKPIEVKSGVSEQPITSDETQEGSINRAENALKETLDADFSLGIEVGYHKGAKDKFEMFCWATILDRNGHRTSGQSHRFLLPEYHQDILGSGKYLGEHLNDYASKANDAAGVYIENMIRHRKPFIVSAIKDVLIRYLRKEDY